MKQVLLFLFITFSTISFGQTYTLSGYLTDANSGESLIGATILSKETGKGTVTNSYGFYSLSMPKGKHTLQLSFIGYKTVDTTINLSENLNFELSLDEEDMAIEEIEVKANSNRDKVNNSEIGVENLSIKNIKSLPTLFGETDVLKVVQLLPGVQAANDGAAGFNVRGGNYDQNLILLDEAVVYNPGHLFNAVSVFNDDAINNMKLYKGTMPASYGGRTSSVVDITLKDGNNQKFTGSGALGLIASKLTLEGPIIKNKSSFLISARRSTIDLITKPFLNMHGSSMNNNDYYFYDITAKVNYKFSNRDRLYFSHYTGKDVFKLTTSSERFTMSVPWGNSTTTLRWNHVLSSKIFMNFSIIQNSFFRELETDQEGFVEKKDSRITDHTAKVDFSWYTSINHNIKAGVQVTNHSIDIERNGNNNFRRSLETSAFLSDEFEIGEDLKFNFGVRYSQFNFLGAYDEYLYNEYNEPVLLLKSYGDHETVQQYQRFEPRLNIRYLINSNSSIKLNYSQNTQYMHLISNSGASMPLDFWISSSKIVKPQYSSQFSIGFTRSFYDDMFLLTAELYGKSMENLIEFGNDYVASYVNDSELNYVFGSGTSHGIELMVKKAKGALQGWASYTFSNSNRKFKEINNGEIFPAGTDVRNSLNLVLSYRLNNHWTFGTNFIFKSGKPYTIPTSRYYIDGELVDEYTIRYNTRLPSYNRLDISATYSPKQKRKRFKSQWVFGVYNVYNRMNPSMVYFENEGSTAANNLTTVAKSVTITPIMPSVSYKFTF